MNAILQDREGNFWFCTTNIGVSRYGGKTWKTFTTKDGLAGNNVLAILQDREGNLWFGGGGGVSRYDGKTWKTFTTKDGLAANGVWPTFQDREGNFWFGTGVFGSPGGVSRYDGKVFQTLTQQDGLAGNSINAILQDRDGDLWFSTANGVTRYHKPTRVPPPVYIDAVVSDRRYEKVSTLRVPSTVRLTAFEFHAISFKTRPEQRSTATG